MRLIMYFLMLVAPQAWGNADYAREQKWADEILPMLVVGKPVYLMALAANFVL